MTGSSSDEDARAVGFLDMAIRHIAGRPDPARTRVLDLGCGRGRLVEGFVSRGYDAYGCDLTPQWSPDAPRLALIPPGPYHLPFPDASFDVVVSTSVLEHVQIPEVVFQEISRVLRAGGWAFHIFPSRWYLPVEPHLYVPLVNIMWPHVPRWWLIFWAWLGVRNEYQLGLSWREVVARNATYCQTGIAYWSSRQYRAWSQGWFAEVATPMDFYVMHGYGGVARLLRALPGRRWTGRLAGCFRMRFLVQRKG